MAALKGFNAFLEKDLSKKTSDWRLGREKYALKCDYVLATGKTPEQLLAEAEAALRTTRDELDALAKPKTAKQALDDVAKQHATPETYMAEAKKALVQATAFVKEKGLLTLPAPIKQSLGRGEITEGHARALLQAAPKTRTVIWKQIKKRSLHPYLQLFIAWALSRH